MDSLRVTLMETQKPKAIGSEIRLGIQKDFQKHSVIMTDFLMDSHLEIRLLKGLNSVIHLGFPMEIQKPKVIKMDSQIHFLRVIQRQMAKVTETHLVTPKGIHSDFHSDSRWPRD